VNTDSAFITLRGDGSVRVSGGVVFCWPLGIRVMSPDIRDGQAPWPWQSALVPRLPRHEVSNIKFYMGLPKWWQVGRWLKLVRDVRSAVEQKSEGER
jgi:hypothetical protein